MRMQVSLGTAPRMALRRAISFSGSVARVSSVGGAKRVRYAVLGAAFSAILIFCPAAKAELCLISVPLTVTAAAFELYAAADVITHLCAE